MSESNVTINNETMQSLLDTLDAAAAYVPDEMKPFISTASGLLVEYPDTARIAELEAALAWLVTAVVADHEIAVTPDKDAWMRRARECGKMWLKWRTEDTASMESLTAQLADMTASRDLNKAECDDSWRGYDSMKAQRDELREKLNQPNCFYAGPGRGDCVNYVGLPAVFDETTTDPYGKPLNWCWWCWKAHQLASARADAEQAKKTIREVLSPELADAPLSVWVLRLCVDLTNAKTERDNWIQSAEQFARNEDYYRGLVVKIGEMCGPDAYVSDDGSVQQDVLCAKVPELVASLIQAQAAAESELAAIQFAAHMPDDYEHGLPSWINQRLYACWIGMSLSPAVVKLMEAENSRLQSQLAGTFSVRVREDALRHDCYRIFVHFSGRDLPTPTTLADAKAEAITWARELLTAALAELDAPQEAEA